MCMIVVVAAGLTKVPGAAGEARQEAAEAALHEATLQPPQATRDPRDCLQVRMVTCDWWITMHCGPIT